MPLPRARGAGGHTRETRMQPASPRNSLMGPTAQALTSGPSPRYPRIMSEHDNHETTMFHFDSDRESFEDLARPNGTDTWSARDFMDALGYANWESFQAVIQRAQRAVINSGHEVTEHFEREAWADGTQDIRLTKFGCYMVAMNASPTKPQVAEAQSYFARLAEAVQKVISGSEDFERLLIRSELVEENKALSGMANARGASAPLDFALFVNAGYRGLYNMSRASLARYKGLDGAAAKRLMDFMGSRELAANLFRTTETKAMIEGQDIRGNAALQRTHEQVGQRVRQTMQENTDEAPENLPVEADIKKVRSDLKRTGKNLLSKSPKRLKDGDKPAK